MSIQLISVKRAFITLEKTKDTIEDVGPRPGQFTTIRLLFGCGEFQSEYFRHKFYS